MLSTFEVLSHSIVASSLFILLKNNFIICNFDKNNFSAQSYAAIDEKKLKMIW